MVDYIGIANDLKAALKVYADSNGRGQPSRNAEEFLDVLQEKLDACRGLFHGFDYSGYEKNPVALLVPAANHILGLSCARWAIAHAFVSPQGTDRGVDVLASPDGFGLQEPHIKVEVKYRPNSCMGSPEVSSFLGSLRAGDKGLYLSTGGFTKEAK